MTVRVASDEREHRRGLVLGLTMAEVLLLLLFLLLLALASRLAQQAKQLEKSDAIIQSLAPVLKSAASAAELSPERVQELAKDLADASRLRRENGELQSQLADVSKRASDIKRLETYATEINPNDPPATTLRKGLERVTPRYEGMLSDLTRRAEAYTKLVEKAHSIDPTGPAAATLERAVNNAKEARDASANAQLGGQIRQRVAVLRETEQQLNDKLDKALGPKLADWKAELDPKTLTLRFDRPDLLFEQGRATLRPGFETTLKQLFPDYLRILYEFRDDIEEVRIEGHTSREWGPQTPDMEAYFLNMGLSQERTRAVLEYGLMNTGVPTPVALWGRQKITANGLSSSRPREAASGVEDKESSRRVEFRVLMKAKEQLLQIVEPGGR